MVSPINSSGSNDLYLFGPNNNIYHINYYYKPTAILINRKIRTIPKIIEKSCRLMPSLYYVESYMHFLNTSCSRPCIDHSQIMFMFVPTLVSIYLHLAHVPCPIKDLLHSCSPHYHHFITEFLIFINEMRQWFSLNYVFLSIFILFLHPNYWVAVFYGSIMMCVKDSYIPLIDCFFQGKGVVYIEIRLEEFNIFKLLISMIIWEYSSSNI